MQQDTGAKFQSKKAIMSKNTNSLRVIDVAAMEASQAAIEEKADSLFDNGQKLFARIVKNSKYYGQGVKDSLFPVVVTFGEYSVIGQGNQYRLLDVDLYVEFEGANTAPTQITFNEKKSIEKGDHAEKH